MKIGQVDVVATAKATFKDFKDDDLQGLAAEVTYHLLFSIVPLLIFLTALTGFIAPLIGGGEGDTVARLVQWLRTDSNLPPQTIDVVVTPIERVLTEQAGGFLSVGALLALWGGKNAIAAMMKALNVAFDVKETRPWWKKTAIAIGLTIALGLALIASSLFFLAGSFLGETVAGWVGLGSVWTTVWGLLRWPLIVALLVVALAFFYWAGPNVNAPFKWLSPGSALAVILWAVATLGLSLYFRIAGGYVEAYGVLGAMLAFVFWLYLMSFILLFGGELNSVLARSHDPETQEQVSDPAKRVSRVGAKRSGAAGSDTTSAVPSATSRPAPAPLPPFPVLAAALPSAEREARVALAAEGSAGRERRFKSAVAALGAAAVAAVSAALLGAGRR